MSGKGSRPRPFSVSQKEFDNRWDAIFKNKEKSNQEKSDNTDKQEQQDKLEGNKNAS